MKMMLILTMFAMSMFAYGNTAVTGNNNSDAVQKLTKDLAESLTVKKMSGTIKWSKKGDNKLITIVTVPTTVSDLSFLDNIDSLYAILRIMPKDYYYWLNATYLKKLNKSKTTAKFLLKDKISHYKNLVIMKLKKGVFTLIISNKGTVDLDSYIGVTNITTDGWATKTLNIKLNVSNDGTTISGDDQITIDYKTKQDKVTKFKLSKGVK